MNTVPDERMTSFIRRHHVLTLATSGGDGLWCCNLFYAYDHRRNLFIFTSEDHTRHAQHMHADHAVAASIVLETRVVGRVQGLQITGKVYRPQGDENTNAGKAYRKRFPYASLTRLDLWIMVPETMKFTDNTLGFGKKLYWSADTPQ